MRYTVLDRAQEFRTEKIFEGVECDCCEFHSHSTIVRRDCKEGGATVGDFTRGVLGWARLGLVYMVRFPPR